MDAGCGGTCPTMTIKLSDFGGTCPTADCGQGTAAHASHCGGPGKPETGPGTT